MNASVCGRRSTHKRFLCGHCGELLGKSGFANHRRLYYDEASQTWRRNIPQSTEQQNLFSDLPDPFLNSSESDDDTSIKESDNVRIHLIYTKIRLILDIFRHNP